MRDRCREMIYAVVIICRSGDLIIATLKVHLTDVVNKANTGFYISQTKSRWKRVNQGKERNIDRKTDRQTVRKRIENT